MGTHHERTILRIIHDPSVIKILADPIRREIIRQITQKPQTQSQIARRLGLSKPSISYHFSLLRRMGLISIIETKVGPYGIVEKYYKATSNLFIEDFEKVSERLRKYYLQAHIERVRGILSALKLTRCWKDKDVEISSEQLEELAEDFTAHITIVGEKYVKKTSEIGEENLLINIYAEALENLLKLERWRIFFSEKLG